MSLMTKSFSDAEARQGKREAIWRKTKDFIERYYIRPGLIARKIVTMNEMIGVKRFFNNSNVT